MDTHAQEQELRAQLRERFLRMLAHMENKRVHIETYQGSSVSGVFRSMDYDVTSMHVHGLRTPIGEVPEALVRMSDIVTIAVGMSKTLDDMSNKRLT